MAEFRSQKRRQEPARIQVPEGEVRVLESHHASDFSMDADTWPYHKICWVAVGRGLVEVSGNQTAISKNDFLILPAGCRQRFKDEPREPLTLVILCISVVHFNADTATERSQLWQQLAVDTTIGQPKCAKTGFHLSSLVENFRLALREQANAQVGWKTALKATADRVLVGLNRGYAEPRENHSESSRQTVQGAIEYVDAHPYENLQIDEIAERCRLSPRRFTELFKEQTGQTYNNYLNQQRISYACKRLDETKHIVYACHESGFNDLAYFYRVFKKHTGQTPGEYTKT